MRVLCRNGHFAFYPSARTEVQKFMRVFKLPLYPQEDYFTFEALLDLPRWSQTGLSFGNLLGVVVYEGRTAWDVMRENEFVFSLALEELTPVELITQKVTLQQTNDCLIAPFPLVQPGAFVDQSRTSAVAVPERIMSYTGEVDLTYQKLYIDSWGSAP